MSVIEQMYKDANGEGDKLLAASGEQLRRMAGEGGDQMPPWMNVVLDRLDRIEKRLGMSVKKDAYTVPEVVERFEGRRAEFTVREWCRLGCVQAYKVRGKGRQGEWMVPHAELERVLAEGPKPAGTFDTRSVLASRTGASWPSPCPSGTSVGSVAAWPRSNARGCRR